MLKQQTIFCYCLLSCILSFAGGCANTEISGEIPLSCRDLTKLKLHEGYKKNKLYTLIFLDYTDSRIVGDETKKRLTGIIAESLITPGDKVEVYFITANTATDKSHPRESFKLDINELQDLIPNATGDYIRKCQIYSCDRVQALDSFNRKFETMLEKQRSDLDTVKFENSDIAGLFYIANQRFAQYVGKGIVRNLYIVSDMEQNCPGFFNLVNTKFSSEQHIAKGEAEKDFELIAKDSGAVNLVGANYKTINGDIPSKRSNSNEQNKLTSYWDKLFNKLGFKKIYSW